MSEGRRINPHCEILNSRREKCQNAVGDNRKTTQEEKKWKRWAGMEPK
jgi:hypothetical protein